MLRQIGKIYSIFHNYLLLFTLQLFLGEHFQIIGVLNTTIHLKFL